MMQVVIGCKGRTEASSINESVQPMPAANAVPP